ncbi:MAG TPA: vitamin B12-dependent ribonucleotide reductase, partial [Phycisphaerales bacterium]|nr:vitamin B12-dependent ribonucleotide reductase [Phycisphaerales bacterium]
SNNSIRLSNEFFQAVESGADWNLTNRTDGSVAKSIPAKELWDQICFAAWRCADPGLQYDGTINEWHTCPSEGRINASNPCSEYMFLDDTACNLASINLMKFYDRESGRFDVDGFEHATRLWTIVLEISVLMAAFPSEAIAERSWKYRTLGLGFANLGAILMQMGIPYDSEAGRAICATVTAILTGRSYATSAEMARELGAFAGYTENKENMLRVIRNHRRAAHGVERSSEEYEGLTISPVPVDHGLFEVGGVPIADASRLQDRAVAAWDDAYALGEKFGYRNAQVSVIAPTGTIGLLMDCDTTGVEPDFALVKFKKLAGGGYFKIANASLEPALQSLGYEESQISDILAYVLGTQNLDAEITGRNCSFREFLSEAGYTESDLQTLTESLPSQFELPFAFNAYSMPASVLTRAGIDATAAQADFSFDGLKALGLKPSEIRELSDIICGTQTIEGAPHLSEKHLAVFDCANTCGRIGTRYIAAEGHIRMMAASQPFLSGAISKTVNLPNSATIEEVAASYTMSWELGLKANALYRDGCKLSQPLNSSSDTTEEEDGEDDGLIEAIDEVSTEVSNIAQTIEGNVGAPTTTATEAIQTQVTERVVERPMRRRLPDTRRSLTHRFNVAGHEGYLTVGLYEDGQPGELFITMSKEGSTIGGLMDSLGTAISVALQYGVPVESLVKKFAHQRFEPMGMSSNPEIPFAKSLVDYIFRWMGMEFIDGFRENNAPKRTKSGSGTASATNKSTPASRKASESPSATITTTPKTAVEPKVGSKRPTAT